MWRCLCAHTLPCLTVAVMAAHVSAQPAQNAESLVLREPVRIAFYEQAPRAMARGMRTAVNGRCDELRGSGAKAHPWYCSSVGLRFFREVNVLGDRYKTGLACSQESVTPNLRFYTEDMFNGDDVQCVYIAYDAKSKRHIVDDH